MRNQVECVPNRRDGKSFSHDDMYVADRLDYEFAHIGLIR